MSELVVGPFTFDYDARSHYLRLSTTGAGYLGITELEPDVWAVFAQALGDKVSQEAKQEAQQTPDRVGEARERLAVALGAFRLRVGGTADEKLKENNRHIELNMEKALDRLDRLAQGEDYIERWEKLKEESHGAIHFEPPSEEALP